MYGFLWRELGAKYRIIRSAVLGSLQEIMDQVGASDEPPVFPTLVLAVPALRLIQEPRIHHDHALCWSALACNNRCRCRLSLLSRLVQRCNRLQHLLRLLVSQIHLCHLLLQCLDGRGNQGHVSKQACERLNLRHHGM